MSLATVKELLAHRPAHGPTMPGRRRAWEEIGERLYGPAGRHGGIDAATLGLPPGLIVGPGAVSTERPLLIWYHGGAFCIGSSRSYAGFARALSQAGGFQVYLPDYPLAPEHVYPAPFEGAFDAYAAVLRAGWAAADVALGGDSAGGTLTLAVALRARDRGLPAPRALVPLSPLADMTAATVATTANAATDIFLSVEGLAAARQVLSPGREDFSDPGMSPLHADLRGLSDTFVLVGGAEILLEDALVLTERLRAAGVRCELEVAPGMPHIYSYFHPVLPQAAASVGNIARFLAGRFP